MKKMDLLRSVLSRQPLERLSELTNSEKFYQLRRKIVMPEVSDIPEISSIEHFLLYGEPTKKLTNIIDSNIFRRKVTYSSSDDVIPIPPITIYRQNTFLCNYAAELGKLELLQWARKEGFPWNEHICVFAAKSGNLQMMKWLRKQGCPWRPDVCSCAASGGHLTLLQWLRKKGCPWDRWTCAFAASGGHLTILHWARKNGCNWDEITCSFAAAGGHLTVLKWAKEQGCPWNESTCCAAATCGHLTVLQWAREQGCPWNVEICKSQAAKHNHDSVLKWINQNETNYFDQVTIFRRIS